MTRPIVIEVALDFYSNPNAERPIARLYKNAKGGQMAAWFTATGKVFRYRVHADGTFGRGRKVYGRAIPYSFSGRAVV